MASSGNDWTVFLLALAALLGCKDGRGVRGENTECSDQNDCAPYHLVCLAPPGTDEGVATVGLCTRAIPPGSCAFYVRDGQAKGQFCAP